MDLGIRGRRAIVCAASKGLGRACAEALAEAGVDLVINARGAEALEATAACIRERSKVSVATVAADVTTQAGRDALLAACPEPDILVNNAGGPPPGDFRDWDRDAWLAALDANMLTPIFLMQATVDGMAARGFGRVVNITTAGVKNPASLPTLGLSLGARSGLTGFAALLARQLVRRNVTINGLLPGPFATDRLRAGLAFQAEAQGRGVAEQTAIAQAANPAGRFGEPGELGAACAFLCSAHAGYITGQNLLMDGGAYPGLL